MSLLTTFDFDETPSAQAVALLSENCRVMGLELERVPGRANVWHVWESGKGEVGEDMLIDDGDESVWRITPIAAIALAKLLDRVLEIVPGGFSFSMAWVGEKLELQVVTASELREIVSGGEFGAKTEYRCEPL
ncbi:MAG: hypothetical protein R3E83_19770 [Burkholderiaceae bacterium]